MPIIGLNFRSIEANINENKVVENVNVNSSPTIEKIEKKEINLPGMKDVLSVNFKFVTNYEPKIGEIVFKGEVLYHRDDMKDILKKWEKDKKIEDPMALEILNAIFRRCLTKAIDLASELRLPPPIRFPIVKPKEQNEYIG